MLAKELKIKNLKKQREYIKARITASKKDGDPAFVYIGYVFPEVINYFEEKEGISVTEVKGEILTALVKGMPVYRFTPKEDVTLTEEELKAAEEMTEDLSPEEEEIVGEIAGGIADGIMGMIFGGGTGGSIPFR